MIVKSSFETISKKTPFYTTLLLTNVLAVTFLAVFATVSTIVSEGAIRGELALSSQTTTWLTTLNLLGVNTMVPSASWFADRFGYKTMLLFGILILASASLFAACSMSFPMIATARFFEGIGSGLIFPVGLATITQNLSPKRLPFGLILYISSAFGAGFAIGLPLFGFFSQFFSWRSIFITVAISSLFFLISCALIHKETEKKKGGPFDLLGSLFLAIFVGSLLIALTYGPMPSTDAGWRSPLILTCFGIALLSLCATIYIESRCKNPTLPLSIFKNSTFSFCCLTMFLLGMSIFASVGTMMEYMIHALHYERYVSGKIGVVYGVSLALFSILSSAIIKKVPVPLVSTLGLSLLIYSYFLNNMLDLTTGPAQILPILILRGIGLGIALGPVTIQALRSIPEELKNKGATLLTFFRQVGGTYGGTLISIIVIKRKIYHSTLFREQITPSLPQVQTTLQKLKMEFHHSVYPSSGRVESMEKICLIDHAETQSYIQAINDSMIIFGYVTLGATLILILINLRNWKKLDRVLYNQSNDLENPR